MYLLDKLQNYVYYIAECRRPVNFIVGTDAGALGLQGKREGGDMQD